MTTAEFKEQTKGKAAIVYFSAKWCSMCRFFSPRFDVWAERYKDKDIVWLKVDVDESANMAIDFHVEEVPMIVAVTIDGGIIFKGLKDNINEKKIKELVGDPS